VICSAAVAPGVAAEDWPSILGPGRDGRSSEVGIVREWGPGGPPLVWARDVGDGYSMPAIVGGRVYHFDRVGNEARLACLDAASGAPLWQVAYPTVYQDLYGYSGGPRASPVVDGERVFTYGADGWLRAQAIGGGELLWEIDVNRRYGVVQNFFGVASTPIVEGELLLVMVGGSPSGAPDIHSGAVPSDGTGIVAFDKASGRERWRTGRELASYASLVVTSHGSRRVGLAFARGGLAGFDAVDGRSLFHYPWRARRLQSVNAATPIVSGDEVFITESYGPGGSLLRMTSEGYELLWRDPPGRGRSMAAHWSTPVLRDGFLYGSSGEKSGSAELRCVEWSTGRVVWSRRGLARTTQLLVEGHLVVLTEYGDLLLVEATPEGYREVAAATPVDAGGERLIRHPAWSPPALSDGLLFLHGERRLAAFRLIPAPMP
jgi:outer membrane protein assembly factor BamB